MKKQQKEMSYLDSVHRAGRIWNLCMMLAMFLYPILVGLIYGAAPDGHGLVMGLIATAPMYWAVGVVETFTYVPMLGAGGSYLSFVTGNISNCEAPRGAERSGADQCQHPHRGGRDASPPSPLRFRAS